MTATRREERAQKRLEAKEVKEAKAKERAAKREARERKRLEAKTARPSKSKSKRPRKRDVPEITRVPVIPDGGERAGQAPPRSPSGDLPHVTVKDAAEAEFYFAQIDGRLAEAWRRDVVMQHGPVTIRRTMPSWFNSTHYAYVDPRLIWYLKRDPSDPLGARWEGYLRNASDAPRGTMVVMVGRDVLARKCGLQIEGSRS